VAPPPAEFTAELLEAAVRQTAEAVTVPCPAVDEDQGVTLTARWGEQLDVRHITEAGDDDKELSAEQVAGYVAKYATKGTEALGVTLDHRVCEVELEGLDVPTHVAELVRACWELGARPGLGRLRLRKWAHMLGFGGHFSTKSRRYSTTLGALRRARVAYAIRRRKGNTLPLDAWGAARGRPGGDRRCFLELHRLRLSDHRGGVVGRLGGCSGAGSAAGGTGGATNHNDRRMTGAGPRCWTGC
jgi:replication initiator protein RepSA